MSIWLTQLANWCREVWPNVTEYSGWTTRARSSGGYASNPLCVMWHHTASGASWDGKRDADYIATGDSSAPLSNLYIDRSGNVWVIAAGATNTNGKGGPQSFTRGTVPVDGMNTRAVGIEMGNNGIGERWPQAQVDAAFAVTNIINAKLGNSPRDVCTHWVWAPTRKIDPATCNVAGPWVPRGSNSSGTWNLDDIRNECVNRSSTKPQPPQPVPDPDEDEMLFDGFWRPDNSEAIYAVYKDGTKLWINGPPMLQAMTDLYRLQGANDTQLSVRATDAAMFAAFGPVKGPLPPGVDAWGNPT